MKRHWIVAIVLVGSLVATGLIYNLVYWAGYESLSTWIWVIGYGSVILGAWAVWLRGLDFTQPGRETEYGEETDDDAAESDAT